MAWFKKARRPIASSAVQNRIPEGLWVKCPSCGKILYEKDLVKNLLVCSKCDHHLRMTATQRLESLLDEASWTEFDRELRSTDPLNFHDTKPYKSRLTSSETKVGTQEAAIAAVGTLDRIDISIVAMEYGFIGGSMGIVVGEKITRAIERAIEHKIPLVIVSCSGGARMMEGTLSLMQMAKISAALAKLDRAALPYIAILTDPTTGGVTASFAMLADLSIAEPNALIGFAGPRVIEQTIRQKLPSGFQRSEFLLKHGMLDLVVHRRDLKSTVARILRLLTSRPASNSPIAQPENPDAAL
jgi:acetyl-CoA carboxylase carboxyl transferase subunit beta